MVVQALLIEAGIASLGKLTEALTDAVDFIDESQKASNALGLSFTASRQRLGDSIDGLRGTYESKIATGLELLDAGFQGNLDGLTDLMQTIRLQDGNTAQVAKVMSKVENVMNASRGEQVKLAETIEQTGYKYSVSADKLVDALSDLDYQIAGLTGFGGDFAESRAILEGEFAGQSTEQLNSFYRFLTDTSEEAFAQRAKLGLDTIAQELQQSTTAEGDAAIIKRAIEQVDRVASSLYNEALGPRSLGIISEEFGKASLDAMTLADNMLSETRQVNTEITKVGSNMANSVAEIFNKPVEMVYEGVMDVRVTNPTTPTESSRFLEGDKNVRVTNPAVGFLEGDKNVRVTNPTTPPESSRFLERESRMATTAALSGDGTREIVYGLRQVRVAVEQGTAATEEGNNAFTSLRGQPLRV